MRKSKNRQHNDQMKKYKQRATKHTHKTTDGVTFRIKTQDVYFIVWISSFSHTHVKQTSPFLGFH
jgi:hypothetical protein